jgi:hypothetical protein
MSARKLSPEIKQLRVDLVEALVNYVKDPVSYGRAVSYDDEQVAELTKQVQRVAKFLGVSND